MQTRVLLRDVKTRLYYGGVRRWVNSPAEAVAFQTVEDATCVHDVEHLTGTEVVLNYDDPACELALPIQDDWVAQWQVA